VPHLPLDPARLLQTDTPVPQTILAGAQSFGATEVQVGKQVLKKRVDMRRRAQPLSRLPSRWKKQKDAENTTFLSYPPIPLPHPVMDIPDSKEGCPDC
jgi:hypothetical protein